MGKKAWKKIVWKFLNSHAKVALMFTDRFWSAHVMDSLLSHEATGGFVNDSEATQLMLVVTWQWQHDGCSISGLH